MFNTIKCAGLVFLFSLGAMSALAAPGTDKPLVKEKTDKMSIQATVQQIDRETRSVTLMGPNGSLMTIKAGPEVKRLDEFKKGDAVVAEYLSYISAEFRTPTADEEKQPLVVVAEADKAPANVDPGASIGAVIRAVVSIEIINRPGMEVTVKGPRGNYVTLPVEDEELITQINIGQQLIMTYIEMVALSLVKTN